MADYSWLANPRGVQVEDPMVREQRGMTLQALARENRMGMQKEADYERQQRTMQALNAVLPDVMAGGWSDDSIRAAVQKSPEVGGALLDMLDKKRKSDADLRKTNAGAAKDETESKVKAMNDISAAAFGEAKNPNNLSLSRVKSIAKFYGMELPDPPTDPRDPGAVQSYLQTIGNAAYAAKDQMSNAETGRHNRAGEANTVRGQDRQSADNAASRGVQMSIAGMTDSRAREFNATARDQVGATRDAGVNKRTMDAEMKLADDYRTQSKGWQETATAIGKVKRALQTATTNPGSALAAGTAFMKILDPSSVVRESELGMALNASGWFDRAANIAQTLKSGRVMTPAQTKNLEAAADALFEEAAATQRQIDSSYAKRSKDYGADPSRVIVDLGQNRGTKGVQVKAPDGKTYDFPNEAAAAEFKSKAGIR